MATKRRKYKIGDRVRDVDAPNGEILCITDFAEFPSSELWYWVFAPSAKAHGD